MRGQVGSMASTMRFLAAEVAGRSALALARELVAIAEDDAGNESSPISRTVFWLPVSSVINGAILPSAAEYPAGDDVDGIIELHNPSTSDAPDLEFRFRVLHADTGTPLTQWTGNMDLPAGSTSDSAWSFASDGWPLGELELVLEIREDGTWVELDAGTVLLSDVTAPQVSVESPLPGHVSGPSLTVLADAADAHSDIQMVEWSIDGSAWQAMTPVTDIPGRYAAQVTGLDEGARALTIRAGDDWGNSASAGPVPFTVDATPPVIDVSGVTDGQIGNQPVTPIIQVIDAHAVDLAATLDDEPFASGTQVMEEGEHRLDIEATDIAGNASNLELTFAIDTTPPDVLFTYPENGMSTSVDTLPVTGLTEPRADVHLEGPIVTIVTQADSSGEFMIPDLPLGKGMNGLEAQAVDRAGNAGPISEVGITREDLAPIGIEAVLGLSPPLVLMGESLDIDLDTGNTGDVDLVDTLARLQLHGVSTADTPQLFEESWLMNLAAGTNDAETFTADTTSWPAGTYIGTFEIQLVDENGNTRWVTLAAEPGAVLEPVGILFRDGFEDTTPGVGNGQEAGTGEDR